MKTYYDWFLSVAAALNDDEPGHEFSRYKLRDLIAAFNAAMCLAAKYREDKFTELRIVKLDGGHWQDVRGCCSKVLDVYDQTDEHGNTIKPLLGARQTLTKAKRVWKKPSCIRRPATPDGFLIESVSIDKNLDGRFTVTPPVPCDVDAYVRVKCVTQPCPVSEAGVNGGMVFCDLAEAAWHYVLAKMLTGDRLSSAAGGNAQYHYRMFYEILGVTQRQEERLESPEEAKR